MSVLGPLVSVAVLALWLAPGQQAAPPHETVRPSQEADSLQHASETHLRNIRQLTFGGENAEAYFSADDRWLIFQSTRPPFECDQIFILPLANPTSEPRLASTGLGKTTCSYVFPDGRRFLYSSTHAAARECPPRPDTSRGYVWHLNPDFDIYTASIDSSDLRRLTDTPGYDAEATISRDGKKIVFTSARDGDLDIYVMEADGKNVRRLTSELGYDGGAFFSYDGSRIVYRSNRPRTAQDSADYRALLRDGYVRPMNLEIFVMNADGSGKRQVTDNGAANFAPYFFPDARRIIFASNLHDPHGRNFDLYSVKIDGTGLERITYHEAFDAFPMFNSDGTLLVWASNRNARQRGDTNLFLAEWVD